MLADYCEHVDRKCVVALAFVADHSVVELQHPQPAAQGGAAVLLAHRVHDAVHRDVAQHVVRLLPEVQLKHTTRGSA